MNRELEALLELWDAFIQTPAGAEADSLHTRYQAQLEEVAGKSQLSKDTLDRSVKRYHARWVRANLPPGFPQSLGLE